MMTAGGNAGGNLSEQMEGEEVLRTVECLRGRLLAERAASRNAKQEAQLMGIRLVELETLLKEETKSRSRAEKRLKFLLKKLESLEIFYVSDESEQCSFVDKGEMSSASSVASTSTKTEANTNPNSRIQNIQESTENSSKSSSIVPSRDLEQNVSQISASSSQSQNSPAADEEEINSYPETTAQKFETEELREKAMSPKKCQNSSIEEPRSTKSSDSESSQNDNKLNIDNDSLKCYTNKEEMTLNGGGAEKHDDYVDNSMALVPMDLPKKTKQTIDPAVLDSTVKEVLDALKHAKEKLQTSMERRRMIKVV